MRHLRIIVQQLLLTPAGFANEIDESFNVTKIWILDFDSIKFVGFEEHVDPISLEEFAEDIWQN